LSSLAYRHQRVQRLRRLVGRRSARADEGRFVIEGPNLLEEALKAHAPIEAVYLDTGWSSDRGRGGSAGPGEDRTGVDAPLGPDGEPRTRQVRLAGLVAQCYDQGARVFELEAGVLARVAGTVAPQPVIAVVGMPVFTMEDIRAAGPRLLVVCVDVRDPGNAGTVVRSAWAAGVDALVCCEGTVDVWNPKAVRSSAGAVLHVPVVAAGPAAQVLSELGGWGLARLGTAAAGGTDYAATDLTRPTALVLGNEAAGLALAELRPHLDGVVSIPMAMGAESLNVGMVAAVLCFEAARQRRHGHSGHEDGGTGKLSGI
jgi:TrmH family RNA methyltransferase